MFHGVSTGIFMRLQSLPEGISLFCDTSFFYAVLVPQDDFHLPAGRILKEIKKRGDVLHTTWDVVSETVTLLRYRGTPALAVHFLENVYPELVIVDYDEALRDEVILFYKRISKKHRISFCDVISFVVVSYLMNHAPSLSFDGDFIRMGLSVIGG